jgi:hypothetical protein
MATADTREDTAGQIGPVARWGRGIFLVTAWLFVGAVALQAFFAGTGLLVEADWLDVHVAFGHMFELFILLLVGLSLVGRLPRRLVLTGLLLLVLMVLQYAFINISDLAGLHTMNALVIFWAATVLAKGAWQHAPWRGPERAAA